MNPAITAPAPCTSASSARAPRVVVTGAAPAVARVLGWLEEATTAEGHRRFCPQRWAPADEPVCDTALVVSWLTSVIEAEEVLAQLPSGTTWVGLAPLPRPDAVTLLGRAAERGVTYVHAPLRQDPAVLPEGARTPVLAYQRPCEGTRSPAYGVLTALSAHIAWMGALR